MRAFENIQKAKPLIVKVSSEKPSWRVRLEKAIPPAFRRRHVESLPLVSTVECAEGGFLRIIEDRERSTFGAEFAFDLAGVVWNGRTRNHGGHDKLGANGDRLISRLVPLLHQEAEVRFMFGGGAETNFSWCIKGNIRDVDSSEDAEYLGASLRRGLRMVLASEPDFNFASRQVVAEVPPRQAAFRWKTHKIGRASCRERV